MIPASAVKRSQFMGEPPTAAEIVQALITYYSKNENWLAFPELRIGTGYGKNAEQRIDFWAMALIPSLNFTRVAYEIKVSRNDLVKELKQPIKRRQALLLSNEFYFVTPPDLVRDGELPVEAGLIETGESFLGKRELIIKHQAPWRDAHPPTWRFVAALVRRAARESATNTEGV